MLQTTTWKSWLIRGVLFLWGLQLLWLAFYFAPEFKDLAWRVPRGDVGAAIRQEDPLYRWLRAVKAVIPETATYVFLDNYEAGKEIEARYVLAPRRHILLPPRVPPDFLFYVLSQEKASFLLIRDRQESLDPAVQAALQNSPAIQPVDLPGPGVIFRVDSRPLQRGFYD